MVQYTVAIDSRQSSNYVTNSDGSITVTIARVNKITEKTAPWYRKFLDHRTAYDWTRTSSESCLYELPTSAAQKQNQNNTDYSSQSLNVLYMGTKMCQYRGLYCWQILYQTTMGRLCYKRMDKDRSKQLTAQA